MGLQPSSNKLVPLEGGKKEKKKKIDEGSGIIKAVARRVLKKPAAPSKVVFVKTRLSQDPSPN